MCLVYVRTLNGQVFGSTTLITHFAFAKIVVFSKLRVVLCFSMSDFSSVSCSTDSGELFAQSQQLLVLAFLSCFNFIIGNPRW